MQPCRPSVHSTLIHAAGACALLLLLACAGSGAKTADPAWDFKVGTNPNALSAEPGGAAKWIDVWIQRNTGFTQDVVLDTTGAPAGTSIDFQNGSSNLMTQDYRARLNVQASLDALPGEYTITLRGTVGGQGAPFRTSEFHLTVGPTTTVPNYQLVFQGDVTVAQGQDLTVPVSIARDGGFTGPVDLSLGDLPAGITGHFDSSTLTGDGSSSLILHADGTVPANAYYLLLKGSGGGIASVQDYLVLWVNQP